jgi:HK97 family phage prohead protease
MMLRQKPSLGSDTYRDAVIDNATVAGRKATFIASSEDVDRYGDIIRVEGWDLQHFKTNPILLFGHKSRDLPVGRVTDIGVKGKQLIADVEFVPKEMNDFAESVYQMVKAGFLNAVSVGFRPTKMPNDIKDPETNKWTGGFEFIAQELLELSVVPVPALPGALAIARSLGVDRSHVERAMLEPGVMGASAFHAANKRRLAIIGASAPI